MNAEYLDYCRVKKIFEKGFGFLTSLYFPENVFFHFSKIKDPAIKEKLEKLKRGEVYLFYTSKIVDGKRRVDKIWLSLKEANPKLIPPFTIRIIEELNESRINIFELAHVVLLLREERAVNKNQLEKILNAATVKKFPNAVTKMLLPNELKKFDDLSGLIDDAGSGKISYDLFVDAILKAI